MGLYHVLHAGLVRGNIKETITNYCTAAFNGILLMPSEPKGLVQGSVVGIETIGYKITKVL